MTNQKAALKKTFKKYNVAFSQVSKSGAFQRFYKYVKKKTTL